MSYDDDDDRTITQAGARALLAVALAGAAGVASAGALGRAQALRPLVDMGLVERRTERFCGRKQTRYYATERGLEVANNLRAAGLREEG